MSKIKRPLEDFKPDSRFLDERGPTKERLKNVEFEVGDIGTIQVRQSPVERLVKRGGLSEKQGQAAQKLFLHWYRGGMAGSLGGFSGERIGGFSPLRGSEQGEFHGTRLRSAIRVVVERMDGAGYRGTDAARILELVVFQEVPLITAGCKIGYKGEAAKVMAGSLLRGGLNILIKEWGI